MSSPPIPVRYRPVITRTVRTAIAGARPAGLGQPGLDVELDGDPLQDDEQSQDETDPDDENIEDVDGDDDGDETGEGLAGGRVVDLGADPWTGAARLAGVRLRRAQHVAVRPAWVVRLAGSPTAHAVRLATTRAGGEGAELGELLGGAAAAFTATDPYSRMEAGLALRRRASTLTGEDRDRAADVGRWLTATDAAAVLAATGQLCRSAETAATRETAGGDTYRRVWLPLAYYAVCGPILLTHLRTQRVTSNGPMTTAEKSVLRPVVQPAGPPAPGAPGRPSLRPPGSSRPTLNDWIDRAANGGAGGRR